MDPSGNDNRQIAGSSDVRLLESSSHRGLTLSPHLRVSVGEEVIETLDPYEAKPRIFHISNNIERHRESSGEKHHVYPAAARTRGHAEASQQRTGETEAKKHKVDNLRRMFFAGASTLSRNLEKTVQRR